MNRWIPRWILVMTAALAPLAAQTLELRSGEVVIGRVIGVDDTSVRIKVNYPVPGDRTFPRAGLLPRSVYTALASRIDRNDAGAHLRLAGECRKLGLHALAIAEAREAVRLDPALSDKATPLIDGLFEELAAEIVVRARDDFAHDHLGSARLAARIVLRDHGDTAAAREAQELLAKIAARSPQKPRRASARAIEAAIDKAQRTLERTAKDLDAPSHADMRDQRALQRGVARLEKVWQSFARLMAPDADVALTDRLATAQAAMRARLTEAYLALGTLHLERLALTDADEWCNKACKLDPENAHLHRLHALILQAKIVSGWWY